jgi:hypothetical protein
LIFVGFGEARTGIGHYDLIVMVPDSFCRLGQNMCLGR